MTWWHNDMDVDRVGREERRRGGEGEEIVCRWKSEMFGRNDNHEEEESKRIRWDDSDLDTETRETMIGNKGRKMGAG